MKIILSRKGFDSGYGGYPSPILPNGRLISFPIPDEKSPIKYNDLVIDESVSFESLIKDLIGTEIKLEGEGKLSVENLGCHLDPDIDSKIYKRLDGWKGLFGQAGAAQGHLSNSNVSKGDIFLFFGWFRQVEMMDGKYRYSKSDKKGKHVIYGYMEVEEIKKINSNDFDEWMFYHPHIARGRMARDSDHVYIAARELSLDTSLKGYGTFGINNNTQLTKDGLSKSKWDLPVFFQETKISYHSKKSWKDEYFQSAAKGQEFVIDSTDKIEEWLKLLIKTSI